MRYTRKDGTVCRTLTTYLLEEEFKQFRIACAIADKTTCLQVAELVRAWLDSLPQEKKEISEK